MPTLPNSPKVPLRVAKPIFNLQVKRATAGYEKVCKSEYLINPLLTAPSLHCELKGWSDVHLLNI